jgi:negative regulator of sigma E activity
MSRLDDELKLLFQRHEPSEDFAERVLARIQVEQKPKPGFWQTLLSFFKPQALPWGVAAAIFLIAILGFVQYQRLHKNTVPNQQAGAQDRRPDENAVAETPSAPKETPGKDGMQTLENKDSNHINHQSVKDRSGQSHHQQKPRYVKNSSVKNEEMLATASQRKSEGEIAKEQLLKALFIASATVNEAKKLAMGDE